MFDSKIIIIFHIIITLLQD